jgi:hypothetical protein
VAELAVVAVAGSVLESDGALLAGVLVDGAVTGAVGVVVVVCVVAFGFGRFANGSMYWLLLADGGEPAIAAAGPASEAAAARARTIVVMRRNRTFASIAPTAAHPTASPSPARMPHHEMSACASMSARRGGVGRREEQNRVSCPSLV